MRQRWLSLALIVAIVLASCASEPPSVDWCYVYDLAAGMPEGASITSGDWIPGVGLAADPTGELIVSFSEAFFIEPQYFSLKVVRLDDPGDITVTANVSVFGLNRLISETMPSMLSEAIVTRERDDSDPAEAAKIVNATMQTTGAIAISQLEVGGFGASPFGSNPCGEPTPTPPPSETPDGTLTPTITPSQSMTPSMTHTAEATLPPYNCTSEFDFSVDDYDWYADKAAPVPASFPNQINTFGSYGGGGWNGQSKQLNATGNDLMGALSISWVYSGVSMDVSSVEWTYTKTSGTYLGGMFEQIVVDGYVVRNTSSSGLTSGSYSASLGSFWSLDDGEIVSYYHPYHRDWSSPYTAAGSFKLTSFKLNGTCIPPTFTPTPTFTGTPTRTPTITNTPNLTHSPTFTRTAIAGGGTGTPSRTPTRTPLAVFTWTPVNTSTALPSSTPLPPSLPPPTAPATPTVVTVTPQTYTPENTSTPLPVTSTPFGTPGGTPWGTPVEWGTPWGTPNGTAIVAGTGLPDMRLTPEYGPVYGFLSTAAAEVNSIPGQITGYIPQVDPGPLFGYVKWAASCVSAQELVGQTLSPIVCHTIVGVGLNLILAAIFMSVRIVRLLIKIVNWIMKQILRVIPTMGG